MYTVTCPQSGLSVVVACGCAQVGHNPAAAGAHHARCQMDNLTSNVRCPPEAGCCTNGHDHEAAANACPRDHDMACPEPGTCRVHASAKAHHAAMAAAYQEHVDAGLPGGVGVAHAANPPPDDCPGGHCHKDIDGCTVCHPVIVTAGMGAAVLRPAAAA